MDASFTVKPLAAAWQERIRWGHMTAPSRNRIKLSPLSSFDLVQLLSFYALDMILIVPFYFYTVRAVVSERLRPVHFETL
jgi:hypothetical protein